MVGNDTRRHIDDARDSLVGKIPDPKSQVEQITIALIYKFMDDIDSEAEELGGKRKFFAGDFARYGWARLMRSGLGGHELLELYAEAISKMPENPGVPQLFRDIFKNAYLPYRSPETLRTFLKVIDKFTYDHSERLGDAFEYLLSVLGAQGDAGQFRTPRHIIEFIVSVVQPRKHEVILDPACGTAGFLISSYRHILAENTAGDGHSLLLPDERRRLADNFKGYDISPDMVRLSLVNMYLHGFTQPHVFEYDTLTSQDRWDERADVILANPPFMTPKGGIRPHNRFSVSSRRSEVLFLNYFLEHLTANGRAGVIVPEGIHFADTRGHVALRRMLIREGFLLADITLPHGVFKPYASVKTHVLLIDRVLARRCDGVLFVEIENDGFSQTDTREPVAGSQLGAAAEIIRRYMGVAAEGTNCEWVRSEDPRVYTVDRARLLDGPAVHMLGRWHDLPNRVVHREDVSLVRLGDVCDIRGGLSPNLATPPGEFVLVVPAAERRTADHWDFEGRAVCIPLISSAGHGKAEIKRLHYQEGRFALANTMCGAFVKDETRVNPYYLYLFLSAACGDLLVPLMCGATNVTMSIERLRDVLVPIPERAVQEEVVEWEVVRARIPGMLSGARELCGISTDESVVELGRHMIADLEALLRASGEKMTVEEFRPRPGG